MVRLDLQVSVRSHFSISSSWSLCHTKFAHKTHEKHINHINLISIIVIVYIYIYHVNHVNHQQFGHTFSGSTEVQPHGVKFVVENPSQWFLGFPTWILTIIPIIVVCINIRNLPPATISQSYTRSASFNSLHRQGK